MDDAVSQWEAASTDLASDGPASDGPASTDPASDGPASDGPASSEWSVASVVNRDLGMGNVCTFDTASNSQCSVSRRTVVQTQHLNRLNISKPPVSYQESAR